MIKFNEKMKELCSSYSYYSCSCSKIVNESSFSASRVHVSFFSHDKMMSLFMRLHI